MQTDVRNRLDKNKEMNYVYHNQTKSTHRKESLCSTVHYSRVGNSTAQHSTLHYTTLHYNGVEYSTIQHSADKNSILHAPRPLLLPPHRPRPPLAELL
jgi:hypothetical protein